MKIIDYHSLRDTDINYGTTADKFLEILNERFLDHGVPLAEIHVEISGYDDYGSPTGEISYYYEREETKKEKDSRLARERRDKEHERQQYLTLKKKFEPDA